MVVMVGPLIGTKGLAEFWGTCGIPFASVLTTGGGTWFTAVKPPVLFTAAKPLLTAVKPEEDTGRGCGVGAGSGWIVAGAC